MSNSFSRYFLDNVVNPRLQTILSSQPGQSIGRIQFQFEFQWRSGFGRWCRIHPSRWRRDLDWRYRAEFSCKTWAIINLFSFATAESDLGSIGHLSPVWTKKDCFINRWENVRPEWTDFSLYRDENGKAKITKTSVVAYPGSFKEKIERNLPFLQSISSVNVIDRSPFILPFRVLLCNNHTPHRR